MNVTRNLLLLALAACSYTHLPAQPRGQELEAGTTVELISGCHDSDPAWAFIESDRTGTGVILDARYVLTAAHVVECPMIPIVHAKFPDGRVTRLVVDVDDAMFGAGRDIARLEVLSAESLGSIAPPALADNDPPGPWCAMTRHGRVCGARYLLTQGDGVFAARTSPGDSGSGVYDAYNRLVGLVVSGSEHYTKFVRVGEEWIP